MTRLATRLHDSIRANGPLPFDRFMEAALYDPEAGYYTSGRAQIGRQGDFYTSVSVGRVFGRLLARQFAEMWERAGRPAQFVIVEEGAHRGDFAADVLEFLQTATPVLFASLLYTIVEPSEALRAAQQERLSAWNGQTRFLSRIEDLEPFTGVHFSNELLDAFPVVRVRWTGSEFLEQYVAVEGDRFAFVEGPLRENENLRDLLANIPQPLEPGHITEINLRAHEWLRERSARLKVGWILAIDYGHPRLDYFDASRRNGTLAAYAQHQRIDDPLSSPGEVDLTAHVEFTSLAETAETLGLRVCGFTDQHHAMVGLGRLHFEDAVSLGPEQQKELRGFQTLMHPGLMGRAFKAICFSRGVEDPTPLSAFAFGGDSRAALGLTSPG